LIVALKVSSDDARLIPKVKGMLEKHVGKENAIHAKEIRDAFGIDDGETYIRTRSIIDHVVREYGLPVGALGGGYFVISNEEELKQYLGSLEGRALEIQNKKAIVYNNYVKMYGPPGFGEEDEI
jgi:hypothetical protein